MKVKLGDDFLESETHEARKDLAVVTGVPLSELPKDRRTIDCHLSKSLGATRMTLSDGTTSVIGRDVTMDVEHFRSDDQDMVRVTTKVEVYSTATGQRPGEGVR